MEVLPEQGIRRPILGRGQTRFVNIKVSRQTADLLKVYCALTNRRMAEETTRILEKELQAFKKRLETLSKLKEP